MEQIVITHWAAQVCALFNLTLGLSGTTSSLYRAEKQENNLTVIGFILGVGVDSHPQRNLILSGITLLTQPQTCE